MKPKLAIRFQGVNWSTRLLAESLTGNKIKTPQGTLLESKHENVLVYWRNLGGGKVEIVVPPSTIETHVDYVHARHPEARQP